MRALAIIALMLPVLVIAQDTPRFLIVDDGEMSQPALVINRQGYELMDIVIYGKGVSGKPIVVIHPDGRVDLNGDPNEAAQQFWTAVSKYMPRCDSKRPSR